MSSILKALKKLDQDEGASADMPNLPGRAMAPVSPKFLFYVLITAGVLIAAGIFLFIRFSPVVLIPQTAEHNDSRKNLHTAGKKIDKPELTGGWKEQRPATISERALSEAQSKADEQKPVPEASMSGTATESNNTAAAQKPQNRVEIKEPETAASKAPAQAAETHPAADRPSQENPKEPSSIPSEAASSLILEDIGLRIQAISWNETPSKRIAVINSRLCREGERIKGFLILKINPDDIVVSNGKKTGTLMFKLN